MKRRRAGDITTAKDPFLIGSLAVLVAFYLLFYIAPILYGLVGSFFDWNPFVGRMKPVGIENYVDVLRNPYYLSAVVNTGVFSLLTVLATIVLALGCAMLIEGIKGRTNVVYRTIYYLPVMTSMVAASLVWRWIYDPTVGILNAALARVGLPTFSWLKDARLALASIGIMTVWKSLGYAAVIYIAGLQGIPRMYYEAAEMDGASKLRVFRSVTVPLLRPTTLFLLVISFIGRLQEFAQMFVMTRGGPAYASTTIAYYIYNEAFENFKFGTASAISFLLFVIILVISLAQLKLMKIDWKY
jgi:multiple sugar transport system permease protein